MKYAWILCTLAVVIPALALAQEDAPAPAAVEPRQPAVGMAQRAKGRGDAFDGRQVFGRGHASRFGQRGRGPVEQREDLQQLFWIARRHAAIGIDCPRAFRRQRFGRRSDMPLHPGQRQPGIDQAGQRLGALLR